MRRPSPVAPSPTLVALVLGESYQPGGVELTRHMAGTLGLQPGQRVLDVASGPGTTALLLAEEFGVHVDGVDLGETPVARSRAAAAERGLTELVRFHGGDAEHLPFPDATFDAVICECAFCTFPAKSVAVAEFARVLRCEGRVGLTDVTLDPARLDPQLATLAGYVACLADARPAADYEAFLAAAGLSTVVSESHDDALAVMVAQIEARVRALSNLNLPGVTFDLTNVLGYLAAARGHCACRAFCGGRPSPPPLPSTSLFGTGGSISVPRRRRRELGETDQVRSTVPPPDPLLDLDGEEDRGGSDRHDGELDGPERRGAEDILEERDVDDGGLHRRGRCHRRQKPWVRAGA